MERLASQICSLPLEVIRIIDNEVTQEQGQRAHGNIDEEDPTPIVLDREIAAQSWADDRRKQRRDAEHRLRGALLLRWECIEQHTLTGGLESAAGQSLDHPEQNNLPEACGHSAHRRGNRENGDRQ